LALGLVTILPFLETLEGRIEVVPMEKVLHKINPDFQAP